MVLFFFVFFNGCGFGILLLVLCMFSLFRQPFTILFLSVPGIPQQSILLPSKHDRKTQYNLSNVSFPLEGIVELRIRLVVIATSVVGGRNCKVDVGT